MSLRDRLVDLLSERDPDIPLELDDDASLIRSGQIDSLGLFNLALWIERETGSMLDLTSVDPSNDWDTIADILKYVEKRLR